MPSLPQMRPQSRFSQPLEKLFQVQCTQRVVDPLGWKSLKNSPCILVAGSRLQSPSVSCPTSRQQHPQPSPFGGAGISSWCERSVGRRNETQGSGHFFSYIQLSLTTQENWFKALAAQLTRPGCEAVLPPCGHFL